MKRPKYNSMIESPAGYYLKTCLDERGWKVLDLAERIGSNSTVIHRALRGDKRMTDSMLNRILKGMEFHTEQRIRFLELVEELRIPNIRVLPLNEVTPPFFDFKSRMENGSYTDSPIYDVLKLLAR